MSRRRLEQGMTWIAAGVLLLAGARCSGTAPAPDRPAAAPVDSDLVALNPDALPPGSLQFEPVRMAAVPEELQVTGRIGVNENRTSRVGCVVEGRIARVLVSVGDRISKGALLAQINSNEVHNARSEYAKAVAEVRRRRAEQEFARNARDRAARLYQLKSASLEQLQRAETDLSSSELAITTAQAEVNRIEEILRHLGIPVEGALEEYTHPGERKEEFEDEELVPVTAPIDGTVMERLVSPGMVVTPATDMFVISDLSTLWVNAEVPEKHLPLLRVGRPVGIAVQAYEGRVFSGRIRLIGASLDPNTRTVQVRCETGEAGGLLKPEMYATITLDLGENRERIMVSAAAVQDVDGQSIVFVRESTQRFRARQVRLGRQTGAEMEVQEGLKPGETVVTAGSFLLKSELLKRRFSVE